MNIKFIGTGSGLTSLIRNHSSFIIDSGSYILLTDAGDGVSKALISQGIGFDKINGILISHLHPDHFSGLAALLVQMKMLDRTAELDIFVNQALVEFVKKFLRQSYIFLERMGFDININVFNDEEKFRVSDILTFYSKQNSHLNKYVNYDTDQIIKFSCSSFLFEEEGSAVFYTGDIGNEKDLYLFEDYGFNVMISETSHVRYEEILSAFRKLGPEKLILTHFDDPEEMKLKDFFGGIRQNAENEIIIAKEGMTVSI